MSKVQIYSTGWCPYCSATRELLDERGIGYEEIDATAPDIRADMIQRAHGRRTVPQIFIEGRHIGGYRELTSLADDGGLDRLRDA
jgi:glutaredoxin 3